ncbi:MAG: hypothetical protein N3A72_07115 [bacterium]|nr:hypothetical protein [bacterium]
MSNVTISAVAANECERQDNLHLWKSRVKSVTVFKNELGFFRRQGEVTLRDRRCVSDAVPPAAFGTFVIFSHVTDELVDIIGSRPGEIVEFDDVDVAKDITVKRNRLEASKYLSIQLTYREKGSDRIAAGRLVSVGSDYVVLESAQNNYAVPLAGIKNYRFSRSHFGYTWLKITVKSLLKRHSVWHIFGKG